MLRESKDSTWWRKGSHTDEQANILEKGIMKNMKLT